jgi:hypothetical protein
VVDIFAARLWDRALIHQAPGNVSEGIRDAAEALTLFEELEAAHAAQYKLLPILQDAAERTVRLVPEVYPLFAAPANNADMRSTLAILDLESACLLALGAPRMAKYYANLAEALTHNVAWSWSDAIAAAGRLLGEALRRGGDPPEVP